MAANSLALVEKSLLPSSETLGTMLTISETLFKSGLLPQHIKSPQAAFAIIQKGMELGIPPMHAMSNIACIQGKPTCNSELMLALIYRDHGDGAVVFAETSASKCVVSYRRRHWAEARSYAFTLEDAKRAGLAGGNWTKYPAAMLRARAISAVARLAFPDSIGGMYTPEELGAIVTVREDGEVVVNAEAHVIDAEIADNNKPSDEQIGQILAADGQVQKRGDSYYVADGEASYQVRQGDGTVLCSCDDYAANRDSDPKYRCVHKWAVTEYVRMNQELNAKAAAEQAR
jgi:hypothetical protein